MQQFTVLHHKIINITQSLQTLDGTINQRQILRIPAQIFPGNKRIIHRNILTVPKSIFGQQMGITDLNILAAIIVPVGIVLYLRMWRFRIRLYRDLNTIKQSNANIISQIKEM